jgi:hypothetical protein
VAESTGKIVFDVDAQKAYQKAQAIGKEFANVGKQITSSIAGVMALANMLDRAADAAKRIREETIKANEVRGGAALTRGQAGRLMGLTGTQSQAFKNIQTEGAVGEEEQLAFMSQLAGTGKRAQGAKGLQYAAAFATGAFSSKELLESAKRGKSVDIDGRMASLSDEEKDEIAIRIYELSATRRETGGTNERFAAIERARQRRDNPLLSSAVEGVEAAPVVGGLVREATNAVLSAQFSYGTRRPVSVEVSNQRPQVGARGEEGQ